MPEIHRLGRRLFLRELGRGTIAVAVLGPAVIACSGDDSEVASSASSSTSTTGKTPDAASTTSSGEAPTTASSGESTVTSDSSPDDSVGSDQPDLQWERVVLGNVSAYVLLRGSEVAIVDTGRRGSATQIEAALRNLGANWDDVDHVILTHLHSDHVGGLGGVLDAAPDAAAYAGEADVAGISSTRPLRPVNDGDEVFGLRIIGTPGHTAGHISVLDPGAGLLVAGDALNESNGTIIGPNPSFSSDLAAANDSVARLATHDFDTAVFGHGEPFHGQASDAVAALAGTL